MPTLYEISADVALLEAEMEEHAEANAGDISTFPTEKLDALQGQLSEKALKVAVYYKNLNSDYEAFKQEKKALQARQTALGKRAERLKAYLEYCVPQNANYKNTQARVKWQRNPPACVVAVGVDLLPQKFCQPREADIDKLKASMQEYEIDDVDSDGNVNRGADGAPMKRIVKQVRWPNADGGEMVLAEMTSRLGLRIQSWACASNNSALAGCKKPDHLAAGRCFGLPPLFHSGAGGGWRKQAGHRCASPHVERGRGFGPDGGQRKTWPARRPAIPRGDKSNGGPGRPTKGIGR